MKALIKYILLTYGILLFGSLQLTAQCNMNVNPTSVNFSAAGGEERVNVTGSNSSGCDLIVLSKPSWITISPPPYGSTIEVSCGTFSGYRTGNVTLRRGSVIRGFSVQQGTPPDDDPDDPDDPPSCSASLSSGASIVLNPKGETRELTITLSGECQPSPLIFKDAMTGGSVPSWIDDIWESEENVIKIRCSSNIDTYRSFILAISTVSEEYSAGAKVTQDVCSAFKEYPDTDGDGFGDIYGSPVTCLDTKDPNIDYVENNDDYCPYIAGPDQGCPTGQIPENLNWIASKNYDIIGVQKSSSKGYFNGLGKPIQTQTKDYKTSKIWASEIQYDIQGRPGLQTSSAPTNSDIGQFKYNKEFIKTTNNIDGYTNANWEKQIIDKVGNKNNTLGHYYSTENTDEPYQDITDYPISKTTYSKLNPGAVLKVEGGRQLDRNLLQGFSYTVPAAQELYYIFGSDYFEGEYGGIGEEVITKFFKTVVIDARGEENVVFTDSEGKILAAARSGGSQQYDVISTISTQGYIDVHIPKGVATVEFLSPFSDYTIYNIRTEELVTSLSQIEGGNFYRIQAVISSEDDAKTYISNFGTIETYASKGIKYKVNYYDYAVHYYDDASKLRKSTQPLGFNASCISEGIKNTVTHDLATIYTYDALGQLLETTSPDEGTANFKYREDGQIRFSQNSKQLDPNADGNTNDQEFSYTNYDALGRPEESGVAVGDFSNLNPDVLTFSSTSKREQHHTTYDYLETTDQTLLTNLTGTYSNPSFLAGNVAKTSNDHTTTYYSYDIYGRVQWMVQNITGLGVKTIDYVYDPITSEVRKVIYQKHEPGEYFEHRYTYDAIDNSLVKVETSKNRKTYTEHARYEYYETGALKNVKLARGIQQMDYVYTLTGQLKAINHPNLTGASDPGGNTDDLFGMSIDYYTGDYKRSKAFSNTSGGTDQYNGNIKGIAWKNGFGNTESPVQYTYAYNRENWLTDATFRSNLTTTKGSKKAPTPSPTAEDYKVYGITYDANGNIEQLNRNKNSTWDDGNAMDQLSYVYDPEKPNQLIQVIDAVVTPKHTDDIKTQEPNNYEYNAVGQLVKNNQDNISYTYNASGLVTVVLKDDTPMVKFYYNDKNHRIKKESFLGANRIETYYVRDSSGSVLAIYSGGTRGNPFGLKEHPIYGASRLGVHKRVDGTDVYQLTDHLGNVRAVITKGGIVPTALIAKTDYYPFGMPMPNRNVQGDYRYAYQGQEKDGETGMEAFELRLWDARIGRWLTTDPMHEFSSPYLGMGNNPINKIDPDGGSTAEPLDRYYDEKGNFLYDDKVGHKIRIVPNEYLEGFKSVIKSGEYPNQILKSLFNVASDYNLSASAWQNIATDVYSLNFDVGELFNSKISIINFGYNFEDDHPTIADNLNEGTPVYPGIAIASALPKDGKLLVTAYLDKGRNTRYNNYNDLISIITHERFHAINGHTSEKRHWERAAYEHQFSRPIFGDTSPKFQKDMLNNYKDYGGKKY